MMSDIVICIGIVILLFCVSSLVVFLTDYFKEHPAMGLITLVFCVSGLILFLFIYFEDQDPTNESTSASPNESTSTQPSRSENHLEENIQMIQERAVIEEQLEQAWNTYRRTNDIQLRMILEENKNLGYVINGRPLREWLNLYPHTPNRSRSIPSR